MEAEKKLGKRIKTYREQREISRETLAENTGLSLEFITGLEEGNVYPSLGPMQKIACALSVRLGTFTDDAKVDDPIITTTSSEDPDLAVQKCRTKNVSYTYHSLGKGKGDRNMEPFRITIAPNISGIQKKSSHQGEEFMFVLKGELIVIYGNTTHILKEGQSIYYNSIVPHYVGAHGDSPAEILAVVYHP